MGYYSQWDHSDLQSWQGADIECDEEDTPTEDNKQEEPEFTGIREDYGISQCNCL